jgi:hypothetical protein
VKSLQTILMDSRDIVAIEIVDDAIRYFSTRQ